MTPHAQMAVIGLGSMGQRYVHLGRQMRMAVVGCDPRRETFDALSSAGVVCVETVSELLDTTTPDVVVIASPAEHHLQTLYAVRARHPGCSVLMEKPVSNHALTALDLQRCQSMLSDTIAVGYCWRFHPYARQLHAVRKSIREITLYVGSDMRTWPGQHYADPLREFSHEIDLVNYLTSATCVENVGFTPHGRYQIDGTHHLGLWGVRIAPFHSPPKRWVRTVLDNNNAFTYHWDVRSRTIDAMYRSQALQLTHATGLEGLFCPLRDGIETSLLVDEIEGRLDIQDKASRVM